MNYILALSNDLKKIHKKNFNYAIFNTIIINSFNIVVVVCYLVSCKW